MKRLFCIMIGLMLLLGKLTACGGSTAATDAAAHAEARDTRKIVVTIFPIYDWVREILGDRAEAVDLTMLLDSGVDLHSYQPTAEDILRIAECDLFIFVGGESDEWAEAALAESADPDRRVIRLLDALGGAIKEEEVVEGMEAEDEPDHDGEEEEPEYDEHIWLSLRNAETLCGVIADALCDIDPENADGYRANAEAYAAQLAELDAAYADAVAGADFDVVLFGDRFPFRYLADDYGLGYYAAFSGCSAETEASFETIIFLAGKADELGLRSILQIESADGSIAQTIRDATQTKDQRILTMDSLQSTTARDVAAGKTYLAAMEDNLTVLTAALDAAPSSADADVDLTLLSGTMVYSVVSQMVYTPDDYIGKTVKMEGAFSVYEGEERNYFACLVSDATACCANGIEFLWAGEHVYPDDYPEPGTEITVTGTFDLYEEDGFLYIQLADAQLSF